MRIRLAQSHRGVALMIVMIAVFVLAVIVGAFAYAMKVEMHLARTANRETELLWLGRSGVDLARYVLAQQLSIPGEPYDALNQKWAGGPGTLATTNSPLADISLENFPVGNSTITVKITDLESRFNINIADEQILQQGLTIIGVDASEAQQIASSILDWIDPDDITRVNGAESDEYTALNPPYEAKNGPLDDLSEVMLIRGVTPEMYWGLGEVDPKSPRFFSPVDRHGRPVDQPPYSIGLSKLFTALSTGRININTASSEVLQMLPGVDATIAACILQQRAGPDGVDGTEDDLPFRNPGELVNCMNQAMVQPLLRFCDVRSRTFEVKVTINDTRRVYYAILGRNSARDVALLSFYWKDQAE